LRQRSVIALALSLASAVGCGALLAASPASAPEPIAARVPDGPAPWTGLAPLREPDEFRFVVVTDRTGAHRDGVFESAMPRINLVRPEFVVSVGDLIEGYSEDPSVLAAQWDEIEAAVGRLQMPFFYAPGNHDMSNEVMAEAWRARFGPSYYHFVYRDVLFVVLNSELFGMVHDPSQSLPGPWTQAEQLAMLERVLGENAQARWTFVFIHQPLWDAAKVNPDWLRVEQMLGRRPYTVFAGHKHRYTSHVRNDRRFVTLATTGGGSPLRGTAWGEFDHVAQVTMTSQGPVIANLLLDGIVDVDVMTAARRRIVNKLARAVTTEPLLGGGERFRSGTARFTIANPGRHPLEVRGVPEQGRHLDPVEGAIELMVAPRTSASVEILVRARSAHLFEDDAYVRDDFKTAFMELMARLPRWDIVLLGYNTDALLEFNVIGDFDLSGLFNLRQPKREQLIKFARLAEPVNTFRLKHVFGTCGYAVSREGAAQLARRCFPMDNRVVHFPATNRKLPVFSIDCMMNLFYQRLDAFVCLPPLVLTPNDRATSTVASLRLG
jgi:hypothetical protein